MITADTITDEQIRELLLRDDSTDELRKWCRYAIGLSAPPPRLRSKGYKRRARARCAEILNARAKEQR